MIRIIACILFVLALAGAALAQTQESADCADAKARATRLETRLQDWPFLVRYHDANTKVAPPAKNEDRVVFMGDSITDFWKLADYFAGKPYINRGISGQTTPQMLIRFRPDVIALKPKVVVILAGTNDIAGNTGPTTPAAIEDNLASMIDLARANGIRVVIASLLPVSDYEKNKDGQPIIQTKRRPLDQIKALNTWIKTYAAENDVTYLDYYSALADDGGFLRAGLSRDGLHPNEKGYQIMQPLAQQAIGAAMKKKH